VSDLPVLPPLATEQLAAWREAHRGFDAIDAEAPPPVRAASRYLLRRLLIEGLANAQPSLADATRPLLFPPPRRFVSHTLAQRMAGAEAAFRYLDVAAAMRRMEGGPAAVTSCMPNVLNALLCGPVTERETNPGLVRMTSTHWMPDANPFAHPDAAALPELLEGALDLAARAPAPAVARAGWLAFVLMTIHPFVDGNGRTARALFVILSAADTSVGLDWGAIEQWSLARRSYVDALQAGQHVERYAGADVDPAPFMQFAASTSERGARMNSARVRALGEVVDASNAEPGDIELLLRVLIDRFVALDTILDDADDPEAALAHVRGLVDDAQLRFDVPPVGHVASSARGRGLTVGPRLAELAARFHCARFSDA
jgi:hypothetical protein